MVENDPVNHPWHYTNHPSGVECIDIVEHFGFCLGNAIKYIWRAGEKNSTTLLEDLKKARWYLDREISKWEKHDAEHSVRQTEPQQGSPDDSGGSECSPRAAMPGSRARADSEGTAPVPYREEAGRPVLTWETVEPSRGRSDPSVSSPHGSGPVHQDEPAAPSPASSEAGRDQAIQNFERLRQEELRAKKARLEKQLLSVSFDLRRLEVDARKSSGPDQYTLTATRLCGTSPVVTGAGDPLDPEVLHSDAGVSGGGSPQSLDSATPSGDGGDHWQPAKAETTLSFDGR